MKLTFSVSTFMVGNKFVIKTSQVWLKMIQRLSKVHKPSHMHPKELISEFKSKYSLISPAVSSSSSHESHLDRGRF